MLDALFHPKSVAVVGASQGVSATGSIKIGAAALKYLIEHRFPGPIYPINPKETELMGLKSYPSILDVPGPVDLACLVIPSGACLEVMRQCVQKGVKAAIVFSSGFAEAGNHELQQALVETARSGGIRFCGPNTAGLVDTASGLTASISMSADMKPFRSGEIAFITQSGALGGSMLSRGMDQGVGFSHWVSSGNEADLDTADYIDYLVDQEGVNVFTLFTEGIRKGRKFLAVAEKAARAGKPLVVYKTGISAAGAAAAASHTGALAGSDRIFDRICHQYGIIRVDDVAELFQVGLAFNWLKDKLPRSNRMGIISASGGICGVGADECHQFGLQVPELSETCQAEIRQCIPSFGEARNPIDCTGQIRSSATGYQDTIRTVLAQDNIDGVLLLVTMAAEPRASFYGREISLLAREAKKPIIVAWTGAVSLADKGYPMLAEGRVPTFLSVRGAVRAMSALVAYGRFQERFRNR